MNGKDPKPSEPDSSRAAEGGGTLTEEELEKLKLAHYCTIEQALKLMEYELETYDKPVYVFKNWCKGCNICVEFCPKETLALGTDLKACQVRPDDCIRCGLCELRCPDLAIFVVQKKEKKKPAAT